MADTTVGISINSTPLSATDLTQVQSVHVEQTTGGRDMVSVVVAVLADNQSNWTSPLDPLLAAPAVPFRVTLTRGSNALTVEGFSGSLSWQLTPGAQSTLSVSGIDGSVNLDRVEQTYPQQGTDSDVAQAIFSRNQLIAKVGTTTSTDSSFTPQQRSTDWKYLEALARRNDFDVWVEITYGQPMWHFERVDPNAETNDKLSLGYGTHGGTPSATVDLLAGRTVQVTRVLPGSTTVDQATDDGTGAPMGPRSLGGWATVRADRGDVSGTQDAATTARSLAQAGAFGATLSVTLNGPTMPLLRARRTVDVTGVGPLLSGRWLVRTVSHTVTQGGHTQALTLVRNALGSSAGAAGTGAGAALSSPVRL